MPEFLGAARAGEVHLARVVGQVDSQLRPVLEPERKSKIISPHGRGAENNWRQILIGIFFVM